MNIRRIISVLAVSAGLFAPLAATGTSAIAATPAPAAVTHTVVSSAVAKPVTGALMTPNTTVVFREWKGQGSSTVHQTPSIKLPVASYVAWSCTFTDGKLHMMVLTVHHTNYYGYPAPIVATPLAGWYKSSSGSYEINPTKSDYYLLSFEFDGPCTYDVQLFDRV